MWQQLLDINFNPHSREGSDYESYETFLLYQISIHTPAKGVTDARFHQEVPIAISIHTPAKGVTSGFRIKAYKTLISIHTPAKGVTMLIYLALMSLLNFNPHSREGSDPCLRCSDKSSLRISIHTPAKGVTSMPMLLLSLPPFQSTLPRRE